MSELSKIYSQYHDSLKESQGEYEERLKTHSKKLKERYAQDLSNFVISFADDFENQIQRLEIKSIAEQFFGTSDIQFVAIDASCEKRQSNNFISFYGGAYGSKGKVSLDDPAGKIRYQRWEMNKDVSMVAFVPLPPDVMLTNIDSEENESITSMSDSEIAQVSSLHTKIMQLAEIYLAYDLAKASSTDKLNLILMDNSIGGILANSSFSPRNVNLRAGDFDGQELTIADMHIALAHPFNRQLQIPSTKNFQPHFRLIAEAVWNESSKIKAEKCTDFPLATFQGAAKFLSSEKVKAGNYDRPTQEFVFSIDPRTSWKKTLSIFEGICEKIFKEKSAEGITYKLKNSQSRQYLSSSDIKFLIGVGVRALIEMCWKRNILLVGVVKDSMSRFFYRNFIGSVCVSNKGDINKHLALPLTDRNIAELLPNIGSKIKSPWSTVEFDACFMTLHPEKEDDNWIIKGYNTAAAGETTRPERIMLRSICQFFISNDGNIASHAIFLDRLVYPQWDDKDSLEFILPTAKWGNLSPFFFRADKVARLHRLNMYLLTVLIKNHFPEALGYPDPLHQADWGAKSLKRRVLGLLDSSEWAFRSRPLTKTFREIRDSFR